MAPPPDPVLRAAVRWLERLPASGYRRCRAIFTTHSDFSDVTPTQYDAAYSWLGDAGLLDGDCSSAPISHQVFEAAVRDVSWFSDADIFIQNPGELPEDALRAAESLGLDSMQAFHCVHAAWGKVDSERQARIGAIGESALVDLLEGSIAARVEQVSQRSDGYGYDIEVRGSSKLNIEVKATLRRNRLSLFLSRHEYETMIHDSSWQLVAIRLSEELKAEAVCSVSSEWIRRHVPRDAGPGGRWESCRLDVPPTEVTNGIVSLEPIFTSDPSPLIDGKTKW